MIPHNLSLVLGATNPLQQATEAKHRPHLLQFVLKVIVYPFIVHLLCDRGKPTGAMPHRGKVKLSPAIFDSIKVSKETIVIVHALKHFGQMLAVKELGKSGPCLSRGAQGLRRGI